MVEIVRCKTTIVDKYYYTVQDGNLYLCFLNDQYVMYNSLGYPLKFSTELEAVDAYNWSKEQDNVVVRTIE